MQSARTALTADLRSPADVYHSEAYLIGCLVKLYGWRVIEPGSLRRCRRQPESNYVPAPRLDPPSLEVAA